MNLYNYKSFIITILLSFNTYNIFCQEQLNIDYDSFLEKQIEAKYNTKNYYIDDVINNRINPDSIYKLIITDKKEMTYFIDNIDSFSKIEKLHLYKVNIGNFKFLRYLEKLRIISLAQNRNINFESLVYFLNQKSKIKHLYITNKYLTDFPFQINKLINLKSLGFRGTKVKKIEINLSLYYLDLSSNKRVDYSSISVSSAEVINLSNNEIRVFPLIFGESEVLRALIFSQNTLIKIDCPVKGFYNLELLDIFSTNTNDIKKSCFKDAKKLEILQQVR